MKLPAALETRIVAAMKQQGFVVWAEFCRVALNDRCRVSETPVPPPK